MATPPPIEPPVEGTPIAPTILAYVDRRSAVRQAGYWSEVFALDPVLGLSSGFTVGVGPRDDTGRHPLVWVPVVP